MAHRAACRLCGANSRNIPEFLTAKELEGILKISRKTIFSYVQRNLIPYVRIQSNLRFRKDEILDWIERQTYRPSR